MSDSSLRPRGTVERACDLCGWSTWYDPLSPESTRSPLICGLCVTNDVFRRSCDRCNRSYEARHRDPGKLCPACASGSGPSIMCWAGVGGSMDKCPLPARTKRSWYGDRDYDLCEEHAAAWRYES